MQLDEQRFEPRCALGLLGGLLLGGGGLGLGILGLLLRCGGLCLGGCRIALGAVGLGGAGFELDTVAFAGRIGDLGLADFVFATSWAVAMRCLAT